MVKKKKQKSQIKVWEGVAFLTVSAVIVVVIDSELNNLKKKIKQNGSISGSARPRMDKKNLPNLKSVKGRGEKKKSFANQWDQAKVYRLKQKYP